MKNIISLFGIAIIVFSIYSCKGNPVEPTLDNNNIVWKADTLTYPGSMQTNMYSIWGSSAENVYTCGHSDQGHGQLWMFKNGKWAEEYIYDDIPNLAMTELFKIYGFADNKIWAVGAKLLVHTGNHTGQSDLYGIPRILRYNGNQWVEDVLDKDTSTFADINGTDENNLWACGSNGLLYKHTSGKWNKIQMFDDIRQQNKIDFESVKTNGTNVFLFGIEQINSYADFIAYFIVLKNDKIILLDTTRINSSNPRPKWGYSGCLMSNGRLYSRGGGGVFEWTDNKWKKIYQYSSELRNLKDVNGTLMAVGTEGTILYNYSGGWKRLNTSFDDIRTIYTDIWSDGKKIFIIGLLLGQYPQKTIILQGQ